MVLVSPSTKDGDSLEKALTALVEEVEEVVVLDDDEDDDDDRLAEEGALPERPRCWGVLLRLLPRIAAPMLAGNANKLAREERRLFEPFVAPPTPPSPAFRGECEGGVVDVAVRGGVGGAEEVARGGGRRSA